MEKVTKECHHSISSSHDNWVNLERPGYFGRNRDKKIKTYDDKYGKGNWRLVWKYGCKNCDFEHACKYLYEESYFRYLKDRPKDLDFICSFRECIDNADTNVNCGCDYTIQEAYSTHIQDIAIRNVLRRLDLKFLGTTPDILVIRSKDSQGFKYGPGNVPFFDPIYLEYPSKCPKWANEGSVEDFWQSNKYIQIKK